METKQFNYIYGAEDYAELSSNHEDVMPLIWNNSGIYKLYSTSMILNVMEMANVSKSLTIKLLWSNGLRISSDVARLLTGEDIT